jgi:hypothetical protein
MFHWLLYKLNGLDCMNTYCRKFYIHCVIKHKTIMISYIHRFYILDAQQIIGLVRAFPLCIQSFIHSFIPSKNGKQNITIKGNCSTTFQHFLSQFLTGKIRGYDKSLWWHTYTHDKTHQVNFMFILQMVRDDTKLFMWNLS